mmetsp:Transcript_3625/g.13281  ORF Transcript_3625/g.13281 Transcript_3625/m.13281 type:complete len:984 (+) Transcript_3625:103-3054(+)
MPEQLESGRSGPSGGAAAHKPKNELETSVQDLILSCNKDGMDSLRKAQSERNDPHLKAAFEQFKYAEAVLLANQMEQDNAALLAVTCNNLGCYYKKVGKYHGALSYLRRALKMEMELKADEVTVASTHLNICAILSKLEKHDKAVQHALSALQLMSKTASRQDHNMGADEYSVLAIAYHSVAKEREFLQQLDQAALAFQTGYQVADRLLGENHPLTITLMRNCEAVLHKSKADSKVKPQATRASRQEAAFTSDGASRGLDDGGGLKLPAVPGATPLQARTGTHAFGNAIPMGKVIDPNNGGQDWNGEEALWISFAAKALDNFSGAFPSSTGGLAGTGLITAISRDLGDMDGDQEEPPTHFDSDSVLALASVGGKGKAPQPLATQALRDMQDIQHVMPKAHDMGALRMQATTRGGLLKQTPFGQAMEKHPEALMDIMDAEGDGPTSKVQDYRPNRTMKRQTRTSRVVRRTGVFNSMAHRDRVTTDMMKKRLEQGGPSRSKEVQKLAAERIQRVWRAWYQYCQENSEWMTITWICATMIQSHWRSYHVRRMRMDKHAKNIQRHIRGFLVRMALRRHGAAVAIQRRTIGMITRRKMKHLNVSATTIQRLVRGGLARRRYKELHRFKWKVVVTMQRYVRQWMARREMVRKLEDRRHKEMLLKATVDLQRLFRGYKGRSRAHGRRLEYLKVKCENDSANSIQNQVRARQARKRVDGLRGARIAEMEKAATFLRKVWMGARTRRKYRQLQAEFKAAEGKIITMQRYLRGCMCRLKLWREAVQTEEELWAAIEIQRIWRGYLGRVRWEDAYEEMWRREMGAAMIQRNVRGWLARVKFQRVVRRLAREQFELARARFKGAQRIQARVRGVLTRKRTGARLARCTHAAMQIQRIARGRAVRKALWEQVIHQRATLMTAAARGFLVRRRRQRILTKVVLVQRAYRRWRLLPPERRQELRARMLGRKEKATTIQRYIRQVIEHKALQRINVATR